MFQAGVARTTLTPFWGVELTGWGYYIERRWERVHDDLNATALAVDDGRAAGDRDCPGPDGDRRAVHSPDARADQRRDRRAPRVDPAHVFA